jgi:hypothetical protein
VAEGEAFQRVRLVRLEHVALEHGVVAPALHLDAEAGEDVARRLDVLRDLDLLRVLEPRLEARERGLERHLVGRAGVVVAQRQVGRLAGCVGEREADQVGADRIG